MAEKAKKDNKNIIIGICAAAVVVAIVIIAVLIGVNSKSTLNDAYFVSDSTKYVLTMDTEDEEDETAPVKTHAVYFYSGDTITGAKTYYEFRDNTSAKNGYEAFKELLEDPSSVSLDGKYVIIVADESEYKDTTTSEIKSQIELMESLKNMNLDDYDEDEDYDFDILDYEEE